MAVNSLHNPHQRNTCAGDQRSDLGRRLTLLCGCAETITKLCRKPCSGASSGASSFRYSMRRDARQCKSDIVKARVNKA